MTSHEINSSGVELKKRVDVHFIFLIHGWLGNELEMGYIETAIRKQLTISSGMDIVTYKPKCNVGKTHDGIVKGAKRLENEIVSFIQDYHQQHNAEKELKASISFVGNSLGGLYARCLIASLPLQIGSSITLVPNIFVTTATPHLGCASHTYIPIPKWLERTIGTSLRQTGRDLFDLDEQRIVYTMGTSSKYLEALKRFNKRVAYINAFQTDFQVPTATAAFLSSSSTYLHQLIQQTDETDYYDDRDTSNDENPVVAILQTKPNSEILQNGYYMPDDHTKDDITTMSVMLDSLGWNKVFLDLRPHVPTYYGNNNYNEDRSPKKKHKQRRQKFATKSPKKTKTGEPEQYESTESESTPILSSAETNSNQYSGILSKLKRKTEEEEEEKKCTREIWQEFVEERTSATSASKKVVFLSHELKSYMTKSQNVHFPTGHAMMIANTKNDFHANMNAKGRPVVDYFVSHLMKDILHYSYKHNINNNDTNNER